MATYHYFSEGYAVPYDAFGHVILKRHLDVPALIAQSDYSLLAVSNVRTLLPGTGFAIDDILEIWRVPAGTLLMGGGVKVTTAGAATTIAVGVTSSSQVKGGAEFDRWATTIPVPTENEYNFDTEDGDEWASVTAKHPLQTLYITNGTVDVKFLTVAETTLIADFWMWGYKVF